MAYRRCLSTRATLLAGRLNPAPSFTYISHHDSDRTKHGEFHSSGPKIESYLAQRRCFGSYFNNTSGQFTGTFRRTGYGFTGNGMLLNRYMSTSFGEADKISFPSDVSPVVTDDVASVITDASVAMEAVASQASAMSVDTISNLEFGLLSLPGYIIEHLMHGVHLCTGLNWWASIVLTTLLVRGLTIPFLVYELKASSKFELMMPRREEIKSEMRARGMKPQAVEEGNKKMDELCKEYGVNRNDPAAAIMGFVVEGTLICGFLHATLRMVRDAPSLKTGGALWFIDLTTLDGTQILPSLMIPILFGMVSLIWNDRQGAKALWSTTYVILASILPTATVLSFLTSDVFCLCFGYAVRNPIVKQALGISEIPIAPATPLFTSGDKYSRMIKNFWKELKEGE